MVTQEWYQVPYPTLVAIGYGVCVCVCVCVCVVSGLLETVVTSTSLMDCLLVYLLYYVVHVYSMNPGCGMQ